MGNQVYLVTLHFSIGSKSYEKTYRVLAENEGEAYFGAYRANQKAMAFRGQLDYQPELTTITVEA